MLCSTSLLALSVSAQLTMAPSPAPTDEAAASPAAETTFDPTASPEGTPAEGDATAPEAAASEGGGNEPPAPGEAPPPGPDPSWDATSTTTEPATAPTDAEAAPLANTPPPTAVPVATPLPPRPIRWRLDFNLGGGSTLVIDRGFHALSSNRHLTEVSATSIFDFRLADGRVFLGGGLAYQYLSRSGDAHSTLFTDLTAHEPEVLGRVSVMTIEGIDAFARVGIGPSITDLDFYSYQAAFQRAIIPRVDGQAGLSLYLPKQWLPRKQASRITAGLDVGVGYTWRGKIAVKPDLYQDAEPLDATSASLGDLYMHGMSWRLGLFLRVM